MSSASAQKAHRDNPINTKLYEWKIYYYAVYRFRDVYAVARLEALRGNRDEAHVFSFHVFHPPRRTLGGV